MRKIFGGAVSRVLVLLVLIGLLSPLISAEGLITNLDGLLPSRNDNPITYPVLQETSWYFGNSWSESLSEPGFVEGRGVVYYTRLFAHSVSVEFYVYRFSNVSSAEVYCNWQINQIKSVGGYVEVPIAGAFAVVYDYGTPRTGISWGVIKNIVFKVQVFTANIVEDPTDQLVSFTVLERVRILEVGVIVESVSPSPSSTVSVSPSPSSTIPEFSSFIILPIFMIATLIVAVIISRKKQ